MLASAALAAALLSPAAPAHDLVLLALFRARVIEVVADAHRDAEVGLLDAAEHLLVERLLQRLRRLHDRFGVGVLGLQVLDDLGVLLLSQPEVVVGQRVAVNPGGVRLPGRD